MNLIEQAQQFATRKHVLENHQLYGELLPYTHHLAAVADKVESFAPAVDLFDQHGKVNGATLEDIVAAAWLHDVVEDTRGRANEVKVRQIEELFGENVAQLVDAVTSEDGPNRKVRNALTYPKTRAAGPAGVLLKLCDRVANVQYGGRAVEMYRKEHSDFRHGLYVAAHSLDRVWEYLEYELQNA